MDAEYTGKDITTDAVEVTDTACDPNSGCVEAYSTAEANYYRFRTHAASTKHTSTPTDSFSVN